MLILIGDLMARMDFSPAGVVVREFSTQTVMTWRVRVAAAVWRRLAAVGHPDAGAWLTWAHDRRGTADELAAINELPVDPDDGSAGVLDAIAREAETPAAVLDALTHQFRQHPALAAALEAAEWTRLHLGVIRD